MVERISTGRNRDPIYAPDGKTWYQTALDEASKRGENELRIHELEAEFERLRGVAQTANKAVDAQFIVWRDRAEKAEAELRGTLKMTDEIDHDSDFAVTIDRQKQIITICGINYAFDLFRGLGFKINPEAFFQIVERGDGVVTIRETRHTNADA